MAKFTKADDIAVPQSVGYPDITGGIYHQLHIVFQPKQGRDLLYKYPPLNDGSAMIVSESDKRISLGTYTLNDRDTWENNNFNESTFQPYLTEEFTYRKSYKVKTKGSVRVNTPDGYITIPSMTGGAGDYLESNTTKFSIDALPFVVNPNNDDIIHLDRYYDREIDKENYELATEGKINLKLEVKRYGRTIPNNPLAGTSTYGNSGYLNNFGMNIDIFSQRYSVGGYIDASVSGQRSWSMGENDGIYLFKLNWNDGTELEHTSEPKLLEDSVLFEHHYEKPGFYSITGVVYRVQDGQLKTWEKFETNILLNPSPNYELNLHDYSNFASIGGISKDSSFVKSLYNIVGISPLPISGAYDNTKASENVIEELNELDKIQILNVLGKVDYELIQPYENLIEPYSIPIGTETTIEDYEISYLIYGCADLNATNYYEGSVPDGYTLVDDGSCLYTHAIEDWDFNLTAIPSYGYMTLNWNELTTDNDDIFTTTHLDGWDIDWTTVVYRIQSLYHDESNTGLTEWLTMHEDTISYDTNTYNFNPDSPGYVEDREYKFQIQIQVPDPDTSNTMESAWFEMEEEGIRTLPNEIGGLVNIYMSQTALDVTPTMLSETTLSSDIDDTYPNSLTITAQTPSGLDFLGWTIQPPNTDTNVVFIQDATALSTTVYWANQENLLSQEVIVVSIFADYTTTQDGGIGHPVNVEIYGAPAEYGNVSYPSNFTLTSTDQNQSINAYLEDDDDEFTYSFDKWEVQSGVGYVGFGPNYVSETSVKNTELKWNNVDNPNEVNASVKAFFSREQITGGNGNGNGTCFLEGTMITMVDGTTKPIEQIQVGDEVMSYDDKINKVTHNKVIQIMFHPPEPEHISYGVYLIINNNIKVTTNHAMLADTNNRSSYKWPLADTLIVGDYMFDKDLNKVRIDSIERVEEVVDTYNFEVEKSHTYIAENVIVNNIGGDGPGGGKGGTKAAGGATSTAGHEEGLNG